MTRDEYHAYRRTRQFGMPAPVRLRKLWETPRLREIHHYWKHGKRVSIKDLPPGSYMVKVLDVREKAYGVMLWDVEVVEPRSMPNIQQVPVKSETAAIIRAAYLKHLRGD